MSFVLISCLPSRERSELIQTQDVCRLGCHQSAQLNLNG